MAEIAPPRTDSSEGERPRALSAAMAFERSLDDSEGEQGRRALSATMAFERSDSEGAQGPRALSAAMVFERSLNENEGTRSPMFRNFTRNIIKKWRKSKERAINKRLQEVKTEKKRREAESKEIARLITRTVPLDLLAKEWLDNNEITADVRIYLVEGLLPTLILGIEKLLTQVSNRNLADSQGFCPDFNPINYLAQYLMRNNPKYSNLLESSPYAKGLRKVTEDLKKEIYSTEENKLAKLKAVARKKREEREQVERMKDVEDRRRSFAVEEQFPEWTSDWKGAIPLAIVQNALLSFEELMSSFSEEIKKGADFCFPLDSTDTTGKLLDLDSYKQFMKPYAGNISTSAFDIFLGHLSTCAKEYRAASLRQAVQMMLQNLFMALDVNRVGQLDRQRVLELFGVFYDKALAKEKDCLRNPREWPVIEVEEVSLAEEESEEEEESDVDKEQPKTEENSNEVTEHPVSEEDQQTEQQEEKDKTSDEKDPEKAEEKADEGKEETEQEKQQGGNLEETEEQKELPPQEGETVPVDEQTMDEETKDEGLSEEDKKLLDSIPDEFESSSEDGRESSTTESAVYNPDTQSIVEGSAFDENSLNQSQFIHLTEKFLGDTPKKQLLEGVVRFVRSHYIELDFDRLDRITKARQGALSAKKRRLVNQLFDLWDIDTSGFIEVEKIQVVLNKWSNDSDAYPLAYKVLSEITSKLDRLEFRECIYGIFAQLQEGEEQFEELIKFLMASVERSFEERRRTETRKRWLGAIDVAAQTSGANLDPVYNTVFQILYKDAEEHGRNKTISAFVSMLENNEDIETLSRGDTVLRYVACTPEDIGFMLGKVLYRNMKAVSWAAVDSGKPIHVPKVGSHGGVYFWNLSRKPESTDGSLIVLPTKDHEKRVIGLLGIDTLNDQHKTTFITHEITFYQGVAKAVSQAIQFIDIRKKTLRVAESAVKWILRRSQNVQNVNVYLVEPSVRPNDGLVVRRMMVLGHNGFKEKFNNPPRLDRKDNLFRDYLFKCVESSETITADAYGERHMAFPLRDAEGHAVAVIDISIGALKALPTHENKEIQRMLRLLAMAHREVAREVAGIEKNIVLEVEKEYESARIDVLFDRLMLLDLRENVGRLDARAFAEIKSYKDPPKVIHDILKAVLGIFNTNLELRARFEEWTTCKQYINQDLVKNITSYDPTARENVIKVDAKTLAKILQDVPQGAVAKHGSLPAQYLFNWAFVCLSLIEHTDKMTEMRPGKVLSPNATSSLMVDIGKGRKDSPTETIDTTRTAYTAVDL